MSWNQFTVIHNAIRKKLLVEGFTSPTPVQEVVLNNYEHHRHFIVASQTGSGKTLAFAIPIISEILTNYQFYEDRRQKKEISCLILTPTRELAIQIMKHCQCITDPTKIEIGTLIGGMSKEKQRRIINKVPHILIATPGRLWDMVSNEDNLVLEKLNKILYLVVDEADRMVELGHFPHLDNIIMKITTPSRITHDKEAILSLMNRKNTPAYIEGNQIDYEVDQPVEMDYEEFVKLQNRPNKENNNNDEEAEEEIVDEINDEINDEIQQDNVVNNKDHFQQMNFEEDSVSEEEQEDNHSYRPRLRTFLVSATLTQQFQGGSKFRFHKQGKDEKEKIDPKFMKQVKDNVPKLQSLLGKLKIKDTPFMVDLTQQLIFPQKLVLFKAYMEEDDKLLYLYNYVQENNNQTFIIFLNSISYANKVTSLLDVLGLKSVSLHSHQQQRQRLKKLDQFTNREVTVLVCTDVAARGLDIVNVENVIHYQIPFNSDTFVHRCGRTARINKEGRSLMMIGPKDVVRFTQLEKDIEQNDVEIKDYKLTYQQIEQTKQLIKSAQALEKESHAFKKQQFMKNQIEKQLHNDDMDVDEQELKQELENIEEELQTKRRKLNSEKQSYQQIINQKHKFDPRFQRRRNALFLSPQETMELAQKLKYKKEQMLQQAEYKKEQQSKKQQKTTKQQKKKQQQK